MSVLIKGMKMPKNCVECPLTYFDFNNVDSIGIRRCPISGWMISGKKEKDKRMNDCPLIEIKTPHGPIVDINMILNGINKEDGDLTCGELARKATIIEAEE